MSESLTRSVISGNMEASHRRVAAQVSNILSCSNAPVANMQQGACISRRGQQRRLQLPPWWHWRPSTCYADDIEVHELEGRNK
jgi:hypothetical protein